MLASRWLVVLCAAVPVLRADSEGVAHAVVLCALVDDGEGEAIDTAERALSGPPVGFRMSRRPS